jgi:hypothetical protein
MQALLKRAMRVLDAETLAAQHLLPQDQVSIAGTAGRVTALLTAGCMFTIEGFCLFLVWMTTVLTRALPGYA